MALGTSMRLAPSGRPRFHHAKSCRISLGWKQGWKQPSVLSVSADTVFPIDGFAMRPTHGGSHPAIRKRMQLFATPCDSSSAPIKSHIKRSAESLLLARKPISL